MTLQAKDLRLGNYVTRRGMDTRVTMHLFWLLTEGHATIDEIEGVPLTSEWLERFGFSINLVSNEFQFSDGCEFTLRKQGENTWSVYEIKMDGFRLIQYVHSLQNLFYALTGTELTLKEETAGITNHVPGMLGNMTQQDMEEAERLKAMMNQTPAKTWKKNN